MKKCFKCGNNVLPGTSTCPGCGNPIRNNTNFRQNYTPFSGGSRTTIEKTNYNNKPLVSYNNRSNVSYNRNQSNNSSRIGFIFFMIFFLLPFLGTIVGFIASFENVFEEFEQYEEYENNHYTENVEVVSVDVTEDGRVVLFLKNNNDFGVDVTVEIEYYDENNEYDSVNYEFVHLAASGEQIVVASAVDFEDGKSYEYELDIIKSSNDSLFIPNVENMFLTTDYLSFRSTYYNDTGKDISQMEVCVVFYNNEKMVSAECSSDYYISNGTEADFFFEDSSNRDLVYDAYEIYLREASYSE